MNFDELIFCTRREAAAKLHLSTGSVDILIARGELKARRIGKRVLIPETELVRMANRGVGRIWPPKVDGKTVRFAPEDAASAVGIENRFCPRKDHSRD